MGRHDVVRVRRPDLTVVFEFVCFNSKSTVKILFNRDDQVVLKGDARRAIVGEKTSPGVARLEVDGSAPPDSFKVLRSDGRHCGVLSISTLAIPGCSYGGELNFCAADGGKGNDNWQKHGCSLSQSIVMSKRQIARENTSLLG